MPPFARPAQKSLMGLQQYVPSPNKRNGLPLLTRPTWPDSDLKNAVGRTIEYTVEPASS